MNNNQKIYNLLTKIDSIRVYDTEAYNQCIYELAQLFDVKYINVFLDKDEVCQVDLFRKDNSTFRFHSTNVEYLNEIDIVYRANNDIELIYTHMSSTYTVDRFIEKYSHDNNDYGQDTRDDIDIFYDNYDFSKDEDDIIVECNPKDKDDNPFTCFICMTLLIGLRSMLKVIVDDMLKYIKSKNINLELDIDTSTPELTTNVIISTELELELIISKNVIFNSNIVEFCENFVNYGSYTIINDIYELIVENELSYDKEVELYSYYLSNCVFLQYLKDECEHGDIIKISPYYQNLVNYLIDSMILILSDEIDYYEESYNKLYSITYMFNYQKLTVVSSNISKINITSSKNNLLYLKVGSDVITSVYLIHKFADNLNKSILDEFISTITDKFDKYIIDNEW